MTDRPLLISPSELHALLGSPDLSIVDASWYLPNQNRDARSEYDAAHIPGAVFFDQDAVVDPQSTLPHPLPSPAVFGRAAGDLGIAETDRIVVYDGLGLFSAARSRWLFRVFGAANVSILDGGLPAWVQAGLPTEAGAARIEARRFDARFDRDAVVTFAQMRGIVTEGRTPIADARSRERFEGTAAEPRAGVRSGHMPGARSLPFTALVADGRLKPPAALRDAFGEAGIDPAAPVVTSCGSGVTAAVINLALEALGNTRTRLYDGSWTEWGTATDTPVETGPAKAAREA